jgi:hypothetical protein
MNALQKGLIFAALQVALVSSLGAKLLWDREHVPRGWAIAQSYDPDLLIRGRYVSITLLVKADRVFGNDTVVYDGNTPAHWIPPRNVTLTVENGLVVAHRADHGTGLMLTRLEPANGEGLAALSPPLAFFIPEHAADPTRGRWAGKLWVEVTIPKKGPPRPIRLARKVGESFVPFEAQ